MGRISLVEHQGKTILVHDFSGLKPGREFEAAVAEARELIDRQPPKSLLSLVDVSGAHYDTRSLGMLKDHAKANESFVRASAVVGAEGILSVALSGIARFSGRNFRSFDDRASALDWLAGQ